MSIRLSIFRPDFSQTNVCKVNDSTWTVDLYDEEHNTISIFVDDSETIHLFGAQLISLVAAEKVNPYKVGV